MTTEELKGRTKIYAIKCAHLTLEVQTNKVSNVYSNQLIRCSSSVGANYRAALRAKSSADFINKLKIVEEELDESLFFLDLLKEFNGDYKNKIETIEDEGEQLLKIIVSSINTSRSNLNRKKIVNLKSKI